jgi:hypothetical protein
VRTTKPHSLHTISACSRGTMPFRQPQQSGSPKSACGSVEHVESHRRTGETFFSRTEPSEANPQRPGRDQTEIVKFRRVRFQQSPSGASGSANQFFSATSSAGPGRTRMDAFHQMVADGGRKVPISRAAISQHFLREPLLSTESRTIPIWRDKTGFRTSALSLAASVPALIHPHGPTMSSAEYSPARTGSKNN